MHRKEKTTYLIHAHEGFISPTCTNGEEDEGLWNRTELNLEFAILIFTSNKH